MTLCFTLTSIVIADDYSVKKGDRIAQLILEKILMADVREVATDADLDQTSRGAGGFGSTGTNLFLLTIVNI